MEKEFTCDACGHKVMAEEAPKACPECGKEGTMQEAAPGTNVEGTQADAQ